MLQLENSTPFKAAIMMLPDRSGIDTLYTVVKGTFTIGESFGLAAEQVPVTLADQHYDEPATSSIRAPSDISLPKAGTDVLITGSAWAPGGRPTWQMDVFASVGPVSKGLRVFGDRAWDASAPVATIAWVAPFVRMPLVWERAFGGTDDTEKGPAIEPRNPVGAGFRASNGAKPLAGLALPNLEEPASLISSWKDAPPPAGFAAVAAHWLPRRAYAGTYDAAWQKSRAPFLPVDFDPRFCQVAPLGLVTPGHLRGGEVVDLRGMTPDGALRFALPSVDVQITYVLDSGAETPHAVLDTLIIEPDAARLVMVWRAALACDKRVLRVREVRTTLIHSSQVAAA
jgi:hypothetical protein